MPSATMMPRMIGTHLNHRSGGRLWRDVVAAWTLAVVVASALLLMVPQLDDHGPSVHFQPFASLATRAHHKTPDVEGPSNDEQCSDRDYVNERC